MAAGAWRRIAAAVFATAAAAMVATGPGVWPARADEPRATRRYVGSAVCADCHQQQARAWAAGPHASPTPGVALDDARCAGCHSTGDGPTSAERLAGVQCEACHGAGAAYAPDDIMRNPVLARALGLRDLASPEARARVCGTCHRARTRVRPFDAEASWREIGHGSAAGRAITAPHAGSQR